MFCQVAPLSMLRTTVVLSGTTSVPVLGSRYSAWVPPWVSWVETACRQDAPALFVIHRPAFCEPSSQVLESLPNQTALPAPQRS